MSESRRSAFLISSRVRDACWPPVRWATASDGTRIRSDQIVRRNFILRLHLYSLIDFSGMQAQVFADFKIHAINLVQESTRRRPIVFRVHLDLPNLLTCSWK